MKASNRTIDWFEGDMQKKTVALCFIQNELNCNTEIV